MASQTQTPAETASQHLEANNPKESILAALDDALLAYIIKFLSWVTRQQLRAVCHRLKALVDEQVTKVEMDLTIFSEEENCLLVKTAALLWPGTRSVQLKAGYHKSASPAVVKALASCEWPNLEIIKFAGLSSEIECAEALASSKGWPALRELHLSFDGDVGLSIGGIKALSKGLFWANLEVLKIGRVPLGLNLGALLASLPHIIPVLRSLCLRDSNVSNANLKAVCEGSWPSLEILDLTDNQLGPESGAILAAASNKWGKLRKLDLFDNLLGNTGLEDLLQGHWPCLVKLGLGDNGLDVEAGRLLAGASLRLPSLRELNLLANRMNNNGICALLEGQWPLLERLGIEGTGGEVGALKAFTAASVRCPNIRELRFNCFDDADIDGIHTLARGAFHSVTKLDLSFCRYRDGNALAALAESLSPRLPSLKELSLHACGIGGYELEVFCGQWRNLEILDLSNNNLQKASAVFLAEASLNVLSGIKHLSLERNRHLKNAGIRSLMEGNWANLETLIISYAGMEGSPGAMAIAASASELPNLRILRVEGNRLDDYGCTVLADAHWNMIDILSMDTPMEWMRGQLYKNMDAIVELKAAAKGSGFKLQLKGRR